MAIKLNSENIIIGGKNTELEPLKLSPDQIIVSSINKTTPHNSPSAADLNQDGETNIKDFVRSKKQIAASKVYEYNINSLNIADKAIVKSAARKVGQNKLLDLTAQEKGTLTRLADQMKTTYGKGSLSEYTGKDDIDMFDALWWLTGAYQFTGSQSQMIYQGNKSDKLKQKQLEYAVLSSDDLEEKVELGKNYTSPKKQSSPKTGGFLADFVSDYNTSSKTVADFSKKVKNGEDNYKHMLEDEKSVYFYLLGNGKNQAANDYLSSLKDDLEGRKAQKKAEGNNYVENILDAIGTGYITGSRNIARSMSGLKAATNQPLSELDKMLFDTTYEEKLWSEIQANSDNRTAVGNIILETINSVSSQVPAMVIGSASGNVGYFITMSANIIGGTTTEAINSGYEAQQGFIHGIVESALEMAVEKTFGGFSSLLKGGKKSSLVKTAVGAVDKAVKNKFVANMLAKTVVTLGQMGSEGVEEFLQELTGPLVRNIIYGENNKYTSETFGNAIHAFVIGALSGGLMSAPYINRNVRQTRAEITGEHIKAAGGVKSVLALAEVSGNDSVLYEKVKEEVLNRNDVDPVDVAALYQQSFSMFKNPSSEMAKAFVERNVDAVISEAKNRQSSQPVSNNAPQLTDAEQKLINTDDSNLTPEQRAVKQSILEKQQGVLNSPSAQNQELQSSANGGIITEENNSIPNIGDDTDVGERIYNRSERQGRESGDSASGSGALQADDGRVYGNGESVGLIRSNSQIVRDSFNRRITLEQKESLKTSVVKNDDGTPKAVYHFTENMFFKIFAKGDIGFHFGNILQAQRHGKGKNGRIITVYLDIKNPIRYRSDLMFWSPNNIAFALQIEGILSKEERKIVEDISENEIIKNKDDIYSSQAATELRRILSEKGYDGIVYENMFEGEGESYIAFYPEQVIIIDDGLNNTNQATPDGAASFLPENGEQGDFEGDVDNDTAETAAAEEGLRDKEADKVSLTPKNPNRYHANAKTQNYMKGIGKDLGATVVYEDVEAVLRAEGYVFDDNVPDGYIDDDGVIHLSYYSVNPTRIVLKHELVHYGKRYNPEGYKTYTEAIDKTKLFKEWLQKKTKSNSDSLGELKGLYREKIRKSRGKLAPKSAAKLNEEMYADFSGETVFEASSLDRLIKQVEHKKRPAVIQYVLDFLSFLKDKLSGKKGITLELKHLENAYADMLREAKNNPTEQNGGMMFSLGEYSERQINNWSKSTKIVIYKNESTLNNFVEKAISEPNYKAKMYFGTVTEELADRIKKNTGLDLLGRNVTLRADNIRKILKPESHGDVAREKKKKQIAVEKTDFSKIKEVICSPDLIRLSDKDYEGKPAVVFEKTINKNKVTVIAVDSGGSLDLFVQTMYIGKNKRNIADTLNGETAEQTSKTTVGTVPNNSIPATEPTVKNNSTQETENYSEDSKKGYDFSVPVLEKEDASTDTDSQDIPSDMDSLMKSFQNGEIDADTFKSKLDELYSGAVQRYGAIPEGENAKNPIAVPKKVAENKPTERFVRTIIETGKLTEDMIEDVSSDILLGNFSYEVVSDDSAQRTAEQYIENDTAERIWNEAVGKGIVSKNEIAVGEKLLLEAIENDDRLRVLELSSELADVFTRAGQTVQAARMLKKMSGIGRLMTVKQNIRTINKDLTEKYGKKAKTVTLNPTLGKQLTETETEEDIETVYQDVLQDVASQVPATWLDKLNAYRYFCLLSNPRTHIRNLVGNTVFTVPVAMKMAVGTALETMMIRDRNKRTKTLIVSKQYRDFAEKDFKTKEAQALLKGTGQLDAKGQIDEMRKTFETEWLEKLTKGNSNLLEWEDMLFKSVHYKMALSGFLAARKIDLKSMSQATLDEARAYAINEAKKATFQDASFIAEKLNTMFRIPSTSKWYGNKGAEAASLAGRFLVEGVLPFKRTPINIVKRGVEYSPIGLVTTLVRGLESVRSKRMTMAQFCDGLASGLTGTGVLVAGLLLASLGAVRGSFDDDEEDKFAKLNGEQEYSVIIGGKSYTIDFAAPSAIPFFIGVELAAELDRDEKITLADFGGAVWNALEPMTNLSMLSGIQGIIDAVRYEDGNRTIASVLGNAATSLGMQLVPSILGGIARSVDSTQRTWYTDKNSKLLDPFSQGILNNIKSKVPGLSYTMPASIDAWGREKNRGGVGERIMENFISPGYYSEIDYDEIEKELKRLYKATGENVFPQTAAKSFEVKGKTKHLTADEWVTYAKAKGELSYDYIHEFTESKAYKKLTDGERAKVITNLYKLANAKAKATVSDYDLQKQFKTVTRYEKNGGSAVTYYIHLALSD